MRFFTADNHFGHDNIIGFTNRPFKTTAEMDCKMIDRWNYAVGPEDVVYHLGDFTLNNFPSFKRYVSELNGKLFICPGGHDRRWLAHFAEVRSRNGYKVDLLPPLYELYINNNRAPIVLCHYPLKTWEASYHGSWHLHGHVHARMEPEGFSLDVGVDNWNYDLVPFDTIESIMKERSVLGVKNIG